MEEIEEVLSSAVIGFLTAVTIHLLFYEGETPLSSLYSFIVSIISTLGITGFYFYALVPLSTVASLIIIQALAQEKTTGSGTHYVIRNFHLRGGLIGLRDAIVKTVASVFTVAFGGSAGLEGPSIYIGSGLGSWLGKKVWKYTKHLKFTFLAGAAAGLTAIFKAPLTGILFALEIPYKRDLEVQVLVPAITSSVVSYVTVVYLEGPARLFQHQTLTYQFSAETIPLSIMLGLMVGGVSLFFTGVFRLGERASRKVGGSIILSILGGVVLALMGLASEIMAGNPVVLGIGYDVIEESAELSPSLTSLSVTVLVILILLKIAATCITLNFGGSGGIFIPTMVVGGLTGLAFIKLVGPVDEPQILVVAAMASMLAATHNTLLTSVALVAETLGPASILPAMVASTISYIMTIKWSMYEQQLPRREKGKTLAIERLLILLEEEGKDHVLEGILAEDVMVRDPVRLTLGSSLKEFILTTQKYKIRVLPVVDNEGKLVGTIRLEDLSMVTRKHLNLPVRYLPIYPSYTANPKTNIRRIIEEMLERDEDRVYIVDEEDRLLGVITHFDLAEVLARILFEGR